MESDPAAVWRKTASIGHLVWSRRFDQIGDSVRSQIDDGKGLRPSERFKEQVAFEYIRRNPASLAQLGRYAPVKVCLLNESLLLFVGAIENC